MKKLHWTDSEFDRTYLLFSRSVRCDVRKYYFTERKL